MLTLGVLIESVLATLYGQTAIQDRTTVLTQNISPLDLSFTVEDTSYIQAGLIEIDTELLRVRAVDESSKTIFLTNSGRGVRATFPANHFEGAEVRYQPVMTYSAVAREIQAELNNLYPLISWVDSYEFDATTNVGAFAVPADVGVILDVRYKDGHGEWQRARQWEIEYNQNADDFPTGVALRVSIPLATRVRVVYGKPFGQLSNLGDPLASAGVPSSVEDILRLGALIRLLPSFDLARLSVISVPGHESANRQPQPNTGIMVGRELARQRSERIEAEVTEFRTKYPVRCHLTR